jgi:hypothetical protein
MRRHPGVAAIDLGLVKAGASAPDFRLSDTTSLGAAPKKPKARVCAPIQSGSVWLQLASASV